MGTLTLADYRTDVAAAMQRSSISNTLLDRWTNQALMEIGYALKLHELEGIKTFSTVASQASYGVTTNGAGDLNIADFHTIHDLGLRRMAPTTRLGKVIPETRERYLKLIGDTTLTSTYGNPRYYHKYGDKLYFRPIPDGTLVTMDLHYWKKITKLVNVGDVTFLHEDFDEAVFLGALYRGYRYFGEYDRFMSARADFTGSLRTRYTEYEMEQFPEGGISPLDPDDTDGILETGP